MAEKCETELCGQKDDDGWLTASLDAFKVQLAHVIVIELAGSAFLANTRARARAIARARGNNNTNSLSKQHPAGGDSDSGYDSGLRLSAYGCACLPTGLRFFFLRLLGSCLPARPGPSLHF